MIYFIDKGIEAQKSVTSFIHSLQQLSSTWRIKSKLLTMACIRPHKIGSCFSLHPHPLPFHPLIYSSPVTLAVEFLFLIKLR